MLENFSPRRISYTVSHSNRPVHESEVYRGVWGSVRDSQPLPELP